MARPTRGATRTSPGDPDDVAKQIHALLDRAALDVDDRTRLLAGALVIEALRPYWRRGVSAAAAHAALRSDDPELADCIEAIAPALFGRLQAREAARDAIAAAESLLGVERR